MIAVGQTVQATKASLLALLTPQERRPRRKWGADASRTFEDTAHDIARTGINLELAREAYRKSIDAGDPHTVSEGKRIAYEAALAALDPRADEIAVALGIYQQSLNAFILRAMAKGFVAWLASTWIQKRARARGPSFTYEEVESEVVLAVRRRAADFKPAKSSNFFCYAYRDVFRSLDHWLVARGIPLEIPRQERRECLNGRTRYTSSPVTALDHLDLARGQVPKHRTEPGDRVEARRK